MFSVSQHMDADSESTYAFILPYPYYKTVQPGSTFACFNTCMWNYLIHRRDDFMYKSLVNALEQLVSRDQSTSESYADLLNIAASRRTSRTGRGVVSSHSVRMGSRVSVGTGHLACCFDDHSFEEQMRRVSEVSAQSYRASVSAIGERSDRGRMEVIDKAKGSEVASLATPQSTPCPAPFRSVTLTASAPPQTSCPAPPKSITLTASVLPQIPCPVPPRSGILSSSVSPQIASPAPLKSVTVNPASSQSSPCPPPSVKSVTLARTTASSQPNATSVLVHKLGRGMSLRSNASPTTTQSEGGNLMGGAYPSSTVVIDIQARELGVHEITNAMDYVRKEEMMVGNTITTIILSFLLPLLPAAVLSLIHILESYSFSSSSFFNTIVARLCVLLVMFHMALIPVVYGWKHPRIRRVFLAKIRSPSSRLPSLRRTSFR
ncbi:hypothetical protein ACOMHN_036721 [Nucella lapillus]